MGLVVLGILMLSAAAVAGVTMVVDYVDGRDDASADPESDLDTSESDTDNVLDTLEFPADDTSTVTAGSEATIVNETVPQDVGYIENLGELHYLDADGETLTEVVADESGGVIEVQSGLADITGGAGVDIIDASGMTAGLITAGSGDSVIGSDILTPGSGYQSIGVTLADDATFSGGDANEVVASFGTGAEVLGGGGDDVLLNYEGSATLIGGAGDDYIDAHAKLSEYDQSTNNVDRDGDGFADVVDGGAGDDRIFVDGGDTVTGGAGADVIRAEHRLGSSYDPTTFTDFDSSEDNVTVAIRDFVGADDGAGGLSYDITGRVEFVEADGDSHLFVDSELVAIFENTTGLTVDPTYIPEDPYQSEIWYGLELVVR